MGSVIISDAEITVRMIGTKIMVRRVMRMMLMYIAMLYFDFCCRTPLYFVNTRHFSAGSPVMMMMVFKMIITKLMVMMMMMMMMMMTMMQSQDQTLFLVFSPTLLLWSSFPVFGSKLLFWRLQCQVHST